MHIDSTSVTLAENDTLTVTLPMGAVITIVATPRYPGQPEVLVSYEDEDRGYRIVKDLPLEEVELD